MNNWKKLRQPRQNSDSSREGSQGPNTANVNSFSKNSNLTQLTELQYEIEQLSNRMAGVERVKNQNWLDTNQKIDSIGQRIMLQEKGLNERVKEIRGGVFANFSKEHLEKERRQTVKISILETQQKDMVKLVADLERKLQKASNGKEM